MTSENELRLAARESGEDLMAAWNSIITHAPLEIRRRANFIRAVYMQKYGIRGACERLNGRTIREIVDQFAEAEPPPLLAAGEREGVRFEVYGATAGSDAATPVSETNDDQTEKKGD